MNLRTVRPARQDLLLPNVQNVAANQTAFLQLPLGVRYHALFFPLAGTTFDNTYINACRVKANGQVIHDYSGVHIDIMNQFDRRPAFATYKVLNIWFERVGLDDAMQKFYTALETMEPCPQCPSGITDLRIEFDISGASAPAFGNVTALVSDHNPDQALQILRRETWAENVAATGEYLHQHKYNADAQRPLLSRLAFLDSDTNITQFRILENNQEVVNRTSKVNENYNTAQSKRSVQAGAVIFDTGDQGNYADIMDVGGTANLQVRTTHTAVNAALPVLAETLGVLTA